MSKQRVLVTWTVNKVVEVEAEDLDAAIEILKSKPLPENPDPIEGTEEYRLADDDWE